MTIIGTMPTNACVIRPSPSARNATGWPDVTSRNSSESTGTSRIDWPIMFAVSIPESATLMVVAPASDAAFRNVV